MTTTVPHIDTTTLEAQWRHHTDAVDGLHDQAEKALNQHRFSDYQQLMCEARAHHNRANVLRHTMRLAPFTHANELRWERVTVFVPGRQDDGKLIATVDGETLSFPLDTFPPVDGEPTNSVSPEGVGVVRITPNTVDELHAAIRGWCAELLGRDDIQF